MIKKLANNSLKDLSVIQEMFIKLDITKLKTIIKVVFIQKPLHQGYIVAIFVISKLPDLLLFLYLVCFLCCKFIYIEG